jgi:hypothetical protein
MRPRSSACGDRRQAAGTELLSVGEPTDAARKSSQVRRPTARSGARFAPARIALETSPGSLTGTIGRCLARARR